MGQRFQWYWRRRTQVAFLLIPALLYRAAIPVGFMPMIGDDGRLGIMFCPGEAVVGTTVDVHAAHHHHHHANADGTAPSSSQHVPCPYAVSAGAAPLPVVLDAPRAAPIPERISAEITAPVFTPTIIRSQSARAPPPLQSS
jgi:hypothetical protein